MVIVFRAQMESHMMVAVVHVQMAPSQMLSIRDVRLNVEIHKFSHRMREQLASNVSHTQDQMLIYKWNVDEICVM